MEPPAIPKLKVMGKKPAPHSNPLPQGPRKTAKDASSSEVTKKDSVYKSHFIYAVSARAYLPERPKGVRPSRYVRPVPLALPKIPTTKPKTSAAEKSRS